MPDAEPAADHPCAVCRGACCESFAIPLPPNPRPDTARWLSYRGEIRNAMLRIELPCSQLTADGRCGVWTTRPQPCRDYPIGGRACRDAVRARRSSAEADRIFATIAQWEASGGRQPSTKSSP